MRFLFTILFFGTSLAACSQTIGGNAAFSFLKFSLSPQLSAAGGVNVSAATFDVGFAMQQPELLNPGMDRQLSLSFTEFSEVKGYYTAGAGYHKGSATTFGASLQFMDYGKMPQTDVAGNISGEFHAADFAFQVSASRKYLQRWQYGFSAKFMQSAYGSYPSNGLAVDAGILYADTARGIRVGLLAKNMGVQLRSFAGEREDLPFDLELGITKKLAKAPFAFSITGQQMHRFDLLYHDTAFNQENNLSSNRSFLNRFFVHLVFATHIFIGQNIEATIGYNRLRRQELILGTTGNGLTGFSAGFAARFEKFHFSYARSSYQRGIAFNQLGIALMLDRLFGLGPL